MGRIVHCIKNDIKYVIIIISILTSNTDQFLKMFSVCHQVLKNRQSINKFRQNRLQGKTQSHSQFSKQF